MAINFFGAHMKITPAHNAVLGYAEWCCDRGMRWPKARAIATDLARNLTEIEGAIRDLERWGLMRIKQRRPRAILRLGDGRETAP